MTVNPGAVQLFSQLAQKDGQRNKLFAVNINWTNDLRNSKTAPPVCATAGWKSKTIFLI